MVEKRFQKKSNNVEFFNIHSIAKHHENCWKKFSEKVPQCRKETRRGTLVSPGIVCYAKKKEKPFWFSSLGQMVQFDAMKFRRTFKNYFGQFGWIEKKPLV